ncbi:MAG: putative tellurite resistance protein B-like protein [Arenicella sp.]|jgi:uncharacterized tellurite resistance protein B-like protein
MFEIKKFELQEQQSNNDIDLHLIAAILMFSIIRADGDKDHLELAHMIDIMRSRYALSSDEIAGLIASARDASVSDHSLEFLAQKLCQHWGSKQREQLLNDFWLLATANHEIRSDERSAIALIANNLQLEDDDITRARYQAEQRLELNIS